MGFGIGLDIGTTGVKGALLDFAGRSRAVGTRENALHSESAGGAEADPREWLRNVVEVIRELLETSGVAPADIAGISASGMVPAVVLLDSSGTPLRRAILQNDARATREIDAVRNAVAALDILALTGSAVTQQSVAPKLIRLQASEPDVWSSARHVVGSYDYILMALGAEPHVEQNWAIESGLFALDESPVKEVFEVARLDPARIPAILRPGSVAGRLSPRLAEETGLRAGTPLIVGGADHVLSAFAAGVNESGDWLVKLGGAGDILAASREAVVDERLYLDAHPIPGRWLPNGCMATSGSLIRWLQGLLGGVALPQLDDEAATREPASVLCLPYFLGEKSPLNDPDLRGTFAGLHLGHDRADLYRSVLEAIAFGFRHNVEILNAIGVPTERAYITNGGSKSKLWKQIHAEVLGTEMHPIVDHPGASLGAALLVGIGTGAIGGWDELSEFIHVDDPVLPDPDRVAVYDEAYQHWRQLSDAVTPISHALARGSSRSPR